MTQPPELKTIHANGLDFAYFEMGGSEGDEQADKPLALCLHGFPDTPHTWLEAVAPALVSAGYRVVAPYTRGYSPTQIPDDGDFSAAALSADVLALIEALGEEEAVVVAHDWGAYASQLAALEAPERFRALVAIDIPHPGALRPSLSTAWSMRHFIAFQFRGWSIRRLMRGNCEGVRKLWRRWSPNWSFGDEELAPIRRCFEDPEAVGAAIDYYRSFVGDQSGEAGRALKELLRTPGQAPTLAITGDSGPVGVDDFRRSERYHEGKWELLVVPEAGHFVHREAPEVVAERILGFLEDI